MPNSFAQQFLALPTSIYVHEGLLEGNIDRYHTFLCKNLALLYAANYPELFANLSKKDAFLYQENLQLVDFQQHQLVYSLLFALSQLPEKETFYCLTSATWLDGNCPAKKVILQNFDLLQIITSWQNEFFYADSSQLIVLKIKKLKQKTNKPTWVHFVNWQPQPDQPLAESLTKIKVPETDSFQPLTEAILFATTQNQTSEQINQNSSQHSFWAVRSDALLEGSHKNSWAKFLKMSDLYGELQVKCKYMLTSLRKVATIQPAFASPSSAFYPLLPLQSTAEHSTLLNTHEEEVQVEKSYLKNVAANENELEWVQQGATEIGTFAFCCSRSKEDLQKFKHLFALQYIEKTEKNLENPQPNWYLQKPAAADLLLTAKPTLALRWVENNAAALHTGNLLGLNLKKKAVKYFLRSSWWQFIIENETALYSSEGFALSPTRLLDSLVAQPDLLAACQEAYEALLQRPALPLDQEMEQSDTQYLDQCVAEALDWETEKLPLLYETLRQQYLQRIHIQEVRKKYKTPKIFAKWFKNQALQQNEQNQTHTQANANANTKVKNNTNEKANSRLNTNSPINIAAEPVVAYGVASKTIATPYTPPNFATFAQIYQTTPFKKYEIGKQKIKFLSFLGNFEVYVDEKLILATQFEATIQYFKLYAHASPEVVWLPEDEKLQTTILAAFHKNQRQQQEQQESFLTQKLRNTWLVDKLLR